jgi:acetyltransferase-like isoleucine patch superfamily enzyme
MSERGHRVLRRVVREIARRLLFAWAKVRSPGLAGARGVWIDRSARIGSTRAAPVRLGPDTMISVGALLHSFGGSITIGARGLVGAYSVVYGHGGLVIGDNVLIAHHVTIIPANHRVHDLARPINVQGDEVEPITIESDVWIGANAVILAGVTVGTGAVVAAGAVVDKDVAPFTVVGGVPARAIGDRRTGAPAPAAA